MLKRAYINTDMTSDICDNTGISGNRRMSAVADETKMDSLFSIGGAANWDRFDLAISNFCFDSTYSISCLPHLNQMSESLVGEGTLLQTHIIYLVALYLRWCCL